MLRRKPEPSHPDKIERRKADRPRPAWDIQEELTAEAVPGGRRVPGSGCSRQASRKSDVVGDWVRVEDKTTSNAKGLRITRDMLVKIRHEALMNGQVAAFVFGFDTGDHGARQDWVAFQRSDAARMMSVVDAILQGDIKNAEELAQRLAPRAYKRGD